MTEETEMSLPSPFKNVFEESRRLLFEGYTEGESAEMKKRREDRFAVFYDKHVVVSGKVRSCMWDMTHKDGALLPGPMCYSIGIKVKGYKKEKVEDYLKIKKSTLGIDEDSGEMTNENLWRLSGFGVFADRDFEKGQYIGPYLGGLNEVTRNMLNSNYSLNRPDGKLLDANGGFWNK